MFNAFYTYEELRICLRNVCLKNDFLINGFFEVLDEKKTFS